MPKPVTYTRYIVQSLLPAPGWQAVYWMDDTHEACAVHLLAHVHERPCNARTGERVPSTYPEEELWTISAVTYTPTDGWTLCIEDSNFCGLLPPGTTLATFLEGHECHCAPAITVQEAPNAH